MSSLIINIDAMQEAINQLKLCNKEFDQLKFNLETIESQINNEWKGESAEAYKNTLRRYTKEVKAMMKAVKELNEYAQAVEEFMDFIEKHVPVLAPWLFDS